MRAKTLLALGGWRRLTWAAALGVAFAGSAAVAANASTSVDLERSLDAHAPCPASGIIPAMSRQDLSRAILGGAPSALERIRLSQAVVTEAPDNQLAAAPALPITALRSWMRGPLLPASRQLTTFSRSTLTGSTENCQSASETPHQSFRTGPPYFGDMARAFDPTSELGTRAVAIKRTRFDAHWARVRRAPSARLMEAKLRNAGVHRELDESEVLARVNRWVNRQIVYRSDDDNYRERDFWATAEQTIARGAGDCEDFAILKMHMLRAAGVDPHRIKLMLLRDLAANSDHAFLLVQTAAGSVILDNTTDRVYGSNEAVAVRPILSFGEIGRWVHAYRTDQIPPIVSAPAAGASRTLVSADQRSVSAVPLTLRTGFSK